MKKIAYWVSFVFSVLLLAFLLPFAYQRLIAVLPEKTHVFHSVVLNRFVYTESVPYGMQTQKTEDHHDSIVYRDELGNFLTRLEFEDALPFIYYRNAQVRGKLPFHYGGRAYGRAEIEKERRVIELKSRDLYDKNFQERIYPLFEANINQVALTFPDNRLRFTDTGAEFVSADTNRVLAEKSRLFTEAMLAAGVRFPIMLVAGNFTTFKPFEFGMLVLDSQNSLFHLKQADAKPVVERAAFPEGKRLRHIAVSENRNSRRLGLAVDWDNGVYLVQHSPLSFIPLEVPKYNADTMDLKLLFDPAELTAVYSDERMIYAHTYTPDFVLNKSYAKEMARAWPTLTQTVYRALFPVSVKLEHEHMPAVFPVLKINGMEGAAFSVQAFSWQAAVLSLVLCGLYVFIRKRKKRPVVGGSVCLILLCGIAAFIPALFLDSDF